MTSIRLVSKQQLMILLLLLAFSSFDTLKGQQSNTFQVLERSPEGYENDRCLTNHKRALNAQNYPELVEKRRRVQAASAKWVADNEHRLMNRSVSAVVNIPVVVHVVYANGTQNITDAQINTQIQVLNEDFSQSNSNFATAVPVVFQSLAANIEFNFCLAQVDPSGAATTGITRTSTTTQNIGSDATADIYYNANGGKDSWDESKYLNIWVCEIDATGALLGYASPPGTASTGEDGVVVDYKYFGTIGTVTVPLDKGRTCTHEVGHYFNLEHIWGDGPCGTDDGVADTPEQEAEYGQCPSHPQNSCSSNDMFMNYMDYVDDDCMGLFTAGQKVRMHAALNSSRAGLLNNGVCGASPITKLENSLDISIFPNPVDNNTVRITVNTNSNQEAEMRIMDITGRLQIQKAIDQYADIDVSLLQMGVYFVEVIQGNKRAISKIIIQ